MVEIQALMKNFNVGTERCPKIDYNAFIHSLRVELCDQRLQIVKQAFSRISGDSNASSFTIGQAKGAFAYEQFQEWADAIEVQNNDSAVVSWDIFRDFYADISMTIFSDQKFLKFVSESWSLDTSSYTVSHKEVEFLVSAIRLNLLKYGNSRYTEEYVLRDLYREYANTDGQLTLDQISGLLSKINLKTS